MCLFLASLSSQIKRTERKRQSSDDCYGEEQSWKPPDLMRMAWELRGSDHMGTGPSGTAGMSVCLWDVPELLPGLSEPVQSRATAAKCIWGRSTLRKGP